MYQSLAGKARGIVRYPSIGTNKPNGGLENKFANKTRKTTQEILLARILERRTDTRSANNLARKLINCFGDIKHVLRANRRKLETVLGKNGGDAVATIEETSMLLRALVEEPIRNRPLLEEYSSVVNYCRSFLSGEKREQFHILMLDQHYYLTEHECLQIGTTNHVMVYPREVMAIALEHHAVSIILVHNHPGGDANPSKADIGMTQILARVGNHLGINITDHIIIGSQSDFSFRKKGILPLLPETPTAIWSTGSL